MRLIDADALIEVFGRQKQSAVMWDYVRGITYCAEKVIHAPTIDAVVVVRCKDCRYCTEYYDRDGYPYWECAEWDGGTDADGYCHYGERRES